VTVNVYTEAIWGWSDMQLCQNYVFYRNNEDVSHLKIGEIEGLKWGGKIICCGA
jgi:hypothetical protein